MASGKILRQLIRAGASGDSGAFRQASEAIIKEERLRQHHLLANDLEKILYGQTRTLTTPTSLLAKKVPTDSERGLSLLSLREPTRSLHDVVLSEINLATVEDIIEQHNRTDVLRSYGLWPTNKILFCGPPGCGKTVTAELVAHELDRPLVLVRIDSVVSSYLGETASNLRKVFEFIESVPVVALFDEFDAIGKERSDDAEHGELKRVVNGVLQMLDGYNGRSIIIAATNHESMLDKAIWRRFEDVLFFCLPTKKQLEELLKIKLRGVRRDFDIDEDDVLKLFDGLSHADVENILRRAIKEMVLSGQDFLQQRHLLKAKQRDAARYQVSNRE